jgi:hypothetical protein
MVEGILEHKGLRNSIIGNMSGVSSSGQGLWFYHLGQKRPGPKMVGPLRNAAALIVRTSYELCAEAVAETRAVYAMGDGIVVAYDPNDPDDGMPPQAWERHGLKVELRAEGEADIRSVGVYRVGEKKTKPYKFGEDHYGRVKWYEFGNAVDPSPALAVTVKGPHWAAWLDGIKYKAKAES